MCPEVRVILFESWVPADGPKHKQMECSCMFLFQHKISRKLLDSLPLKFTSPCSDMPLTAWDFPCLTGSQESGHDVNIFLYISHCHQLLTQLLLGILPSGKSQHKVRMTNVAVCFHTYSSTWGLISQSLFLRGRLCLHRGSLYITGCRALTAGSPDRTRWSFLFYFDTWHLKWCHTLHHYVTICTSCNTVFCCRPI